MVGEPGRVAICAMLHELSEALQATGNYLGALRRSMGEGSGQPPDAEVLEQAMSQLCRAHHATRELRAYQEQRPTAD